MGVIATSGRVAATGRPGTAARIATVFTLALLLAGAGCLAADERVDPMDIIIALDKSLSMEQEIAAVKEYVATSIVDKLVIPGDLLIIVDFYGKTDILVSTVVSDAASKETIKKAVRSIRADGRWTDIGGALDELRRQLEARGRSGIPKHLLLITDGKPEPPPGSKYWSPDGSFTHEFLDNTRTIQKAGWKVQVLGVGSGADARELAQKLSGVYSEVPDNPTVQQLTETTREFLGSMTIDGTPRISAVGRGGSGTIGLKVKSSGFQAPQTVVLTGIKLLAGREARDNVLPAPQTFEIPASGSTEVSIRFILDPELAPGRYTGTFDLSYSSQEQFMPTVLTTDFRVNTVLRNNLGFVVAGAALALVGAAALVLLLARRSAAGGRVSFRLVVTEVPLKKGQDVFTLRPGTDRFLQEAEDVVSLTEQKTDRSIARLYVTAAEPASPVLAMEVLEPKGFVHPKDVPASPLGAEIVVKTAKDRKLHVRFEAAAPDA